MTFEELPERAAFTWRDYFPDHVVMIKTGQRQHGYYGSHGRENLVAVDDATAARRVRRWAITKDSMDPDELAAAASQPPQAAPPGVQSES